MEHVPLPDGVRFVSFDVQKLHELWLKLRPYHTRFGEASLQDPENFRRRMLSPNSIVLETENGIILGEKLIPGSRIEVHVSFWDHKLSAHAELFQECLIWVILEYDLERIETFVDDYAVSVRRFLEKKMHFTHEGVMRNRIRLRGRFVDVHIYSILRDEVLGGE